ncbi:MAG TPA: helix-turn-helix domain-containing protein [Acidimicrobiales bacterium]
MQERLLDATVECLVEVGWARTTLPEVVARADVARGAQVHHFPTKAALMAAVGEHLLERHRREFSEAFEALRPEERTLEAAIDGLWGILCSPTWTAVIELGLASRTDPVIAVSFEGFTDRVDETVLAIVNDYFPALAQSPIGTAVVRGTLALLYGLALQTSIDGDRLGHHAEVVAQFKLLCTALAPALVVSAASSVGSTPTEAVVETTPASPQLPPDYDQQGDHR